MNSDRKIFGTGLQLIDLGPGKTNGFSLDIGGSSEGIIGKLNGKQVVAIDMVKQELLETHNEALEIVMDATDRPTNALPSLWSDTFPSEVVGFQELLRRDA